VTEGLLKAVEIAEAGYQGLVIWSPDDVFSAGANLEALMPVFMAKGAKGIAPEEKKLQDMMLRLRYAQVPVVAAVRGMALGGGCELAVHCAARGGHGKLHGPGGSGRGPGAGRRRPDLHRPPRRRGAAAAPDDVLNFLKEGFQAAAMAKVGTSALESRKLGYLLDSDIVVPHKDELLFVAISQAKAMAAAATVRRWQALPVAGRTGWPPSRPRWSTCATAASSAARLPHRQPDRRRGVRRRRGRRHAGDRGIPDGAGAQALLRPAGAPQDPGTHHGHAADRQAGAQLMAVPR
jgi:3-hydroxyacyl-CoA dehydrogenase